MFRLVVGLSIICLVLASVDVNEDRVVAGKGASIYMYPYQVSLEMNGRHFCGGSIIRENTILTAAHCLADPIGQNQVGALTCRAGTHVREQGGIVKRASMAVNHPGYNARTFENDVAILILSSPLVYNNAIKPMKLATSSSQCGLGLSCVLTGWGKIHEYIQPLPELLQFIEMVLLDAATCGSQRYGYGADIKSSMICATPTTPGGGSCQGDSGGPLCSSAPGGSAIKQCGIVSHGRVCGDPMYPGVYTAVFHPMIASFIKQYAPDAYQ